jgi:hypothetical protein
MIDSDDQRDGSDGAVYVYLATIPCSLGWSKNDVALYSIRLDSRRQAIENSEPAVIQGALKRARRSKQSDCRVILDIERNYIQRE